MNILRSSSIAAFTTLYCVTMLPLCGVENPTVADKSSDSLSLELAAIVQKYDGNASFAVQAAWANKVLCYNKNVFAGIDPELYEIAADALTVLNGSIDNEVQFLTPKLQERPYKKWVLGFDIVATALGASLLIKRNSFFIPRALGFCVALSGLATCRYAERSRQAFLDTNIKNLWKLRSNITTWIKAPSPFKQTVGEVQTGDLYPDVDKS